MTDKNPIVVMKGITIEFPGVKALDGVDLTLYPGEVHALMGENGAGKSTMIKALTGVYKINAGSIMVDGKPQQFNGTLDAQNAGIATVYQEVNLCTNLSASTGRRPTRPPRSIWHRWASNPLTRTLR